MLRDKSLIPLSHQHQHGLALSVRIERATLDAATVAAYNAEIDEIWNCELRFHFEAEESVLFPESQHIDGLRKLTELLIADHRAIQRFARRASEKTLDANALREFARLLSEHIRKEERELFEQLQQQFPEEYLSELGVRLTALLARNSGPTCGLKVPPLP